MLRLLRRVPLHFHPGNARPIHIDHRKGVTLLDNRLPSLWNMPQTCQQEAGQGVVMC